MISGPREDAPCWFVLNHIASSFQNQAQKAVDRFNRSQGCDLELFAPTYVNREVKNGEIRMKTVNLTFHYVFVRGSFSEVKRLCGHDNGFSFLVDRSSATKYAVISDRDMAGFRNIARAYKNCLPYLPLKDIDLEEGDLVEVINGDFPGLVGTYMPRPRSKSGDIVLTVLNNVGTIAFDVKASDVRVLEFSAKSTRANDQIDAIVPHLLQALRLHHTEAELPPGLVARLTVFCSRMERVRLGNRKLNAKLQALLLGAGRILGNREVIAGAQSKYEQLRASVTNEWTQALIHLVLRVSGGESPGPLTVAHPAVSSFQRQLAEEYRHYNKLNTQTTPTHSNT